MKITQNEKGQTQYHLEKINDLLIIPEDVWDRNGGWDTFKMAINSMRLMLTVNEGSGEGEELIRDHILNTPFILTDDGDSIAGIRIEDDIYDVENKGGYEMRFVLRGDKE